MSSNGVVLAPDFLQPVVVPDLVRIGSPHDGGYVLPRSAIEQSEALLSFGLSYNWDFERDFAKARPGVRIDAYDHTIGQSEMLAELKNEAAKALVLQFNLRRFARWLKRLVRYKLLFRGNVRHFHRRVCNEARSDIDAALPTILARMENARSFILKSDIEGSEYDIIDSLIDVQDRISCIIFEFHDVNDKIEEFKEAIRKLERHFVNVHLHFNNYSGLGAYGMADVVEVTFLHRRLHRCDPVKRTSLPVEGLDSPCDPSLEDVPIAFKAA